MGENTHYLIPAYWETIINWHNLGIKYAGFSKEVAEANLKFLNKLKLDKTKTQAIQITSKGYLFKGDIEIKLK